MNRIGTIAVEMYKETGREEFLYDHLHPEIARKILSVVDEIDDVPQRKKATTHFPRSDVDCVIGASRLVTYVG